MSTEQDGSEATNTDQPSTDDEFSRVCDGCATTTGQIRLVETIDPDGMVRVCEDCEADLRGTIEQVVAGDE